MELAETLLRGLGGLLAYAGLAVVFYGIWRGTRRAPGRTSGRAGPSRHTAGLAMSELLHAARAVVLWLVPSNTILDQTADALRDARHPSRRWIRRTLRANRVR